MGAAKKTPVVQTSKKQTSATLKQEKSSGTSALQSENTDIYPIPYEEIQTGVKENSRSDQKKVGPHIIRNTSRSVRNWLEHLPSSNDFEDMSQPPAKRLRSQSSGIDASKKHNTGTEGTTSESKYSIYKDAGYPTLLAQMNSFMEESEIGPLQKERKFCTKLLKRTNPIPNDEFFEKLYSQILRILKNRSELRVCIDLHPRLVPSAELLSLLEPNKINNLVEGNNDRWTKAIPFCKTLPQPDRTVAYNNQAFTEQQQRKIGLVYGQKSFFSVREGMYFPFFTCEVKCGKQSLELADRSNANSMTIAVRAIVELHRRAGRPMAVHRRIVGFSMSHDHRDVRIYGHYPEIKGENTRYYCYAIYNHCCLNSNDKWKPYAFMYNLYTQFAPKHLDSIREMIDRLPDPPTRLIKVAANLVNTSEVDSRENASTTPTSQDEMAILRPGAPRSRVSYKGELQAFQEAAKAREEAHMEESAQQKAREEAFITQIRTLTDQMERQREESDRWKAREDLHAAQMTALLHEMKRQQEESDRQIKDLIARNHC